MSTASGIAGSFGYGADTTWGTYKAPDHFVEVVSESLKLQIDRIESKGIRASNRVLRSDRWVANKKGISALSLSRMLGIGYKSVGNLDVHFEDVHSPLPVGQGLQDFNAGEFACVHAGLQRGC